MEKRMLCVFSHPDDESYGPAGTIRHVASEIDGRVRIISATRGEAGSIGISRTYTPFELGRVRQGEFLASAAILESEASILGFPDKHLVELDIDPIVDHVVQEIRLFRPQVVLAFHPEGISRHPDHITMTKAARIAFDKSADATFTPKSAPPNRDARPWQADRLFYYSLTKSRAKAVEHFRRNIHTVDDREIDLILDVSRHVARKREACLAHGTQRDFYYQLLTAEGGIDRYWALEHHILGAWTGTRPAAPLADLWDGIDLGRG